MEDTSERRFDFTSEWAQAYQAAWNREPPEADVRRDTAFAGAIGLGWPDDDNARCLLVVRAGRVVEAGGYDGRRLDWDLRASREHWCRWSAGAVEALDLGIAMAARRLVVRRGDYDRLIEDAHGAGALLGAFRLLARVSPQGGVERVAA